MDIQSPKASEEANGILQETTVTKEITRRDFLFLTTTTMGVVGLGAVAWPFLNSMNPAADVLSLSNAEVDLKLIPEGTTKIALWRGKPLFIRHRTEEEIKGVRQIPLKELIDPQSDEERFGKNPQWLVVVGVCTHLGCIPNQRAGMTATPKIKEGKVGGWLCPCHGSVYDASGRVRVGPAPRNLEVPPYKITNTLLRVG